MDVIKEREGKRTVDDKGGSERISNGCNKGGSERNSHSPITAVE